MKRKGRVVALVWGMSQLLLIGCGANGDDISSDGSVEHFATQTAALRGGPGASVGAAQHRRHQSPPSAAAAVNAAAPAQNAAFDTHEPLPDCQPSHMTLQGGQPMQGDLPSGSNRVTIVPVEWGSAPLGYNMSQIDGFVNTVFQGISPWYVWLKHEYHLPNIAQTAMKSITITPARAGLQVLRRADIEAELEAHLLDGTLPVSNVNHYVSSMLYVIHLPSTVTASATDDPNNLLCGGLNGTTWTSPKACAYNQVSLVKHDERVFQYAIVPDVTTGTCATACSSPAVATTFDNETMIESHELIEALSDPPGGWYDSAIHSSGSAGSGVGADGTCGQIADPCAGKPITTQGAPLTATVQMIWSNIANTCVGNSGGALGDFQNKGTSAVVLAGDTDAGTPTTAIHYAQSSVAQTTNVVLAATDASVDANWMTWQKTGKAVIGDFDGDAKPDIALIGSSTTSIPTASNFAGIFPIVANSALLTTTPAAEIGTPDTNFTTLATQTKFPPVTGDFNGDGATDVALVGGTGWNTIAIAYGAVSANAQPRFWSVAKPDGGLNAAIAASKNTPQVVAGDFNGDGLTDLALVGVTSSAGLGTSTISVWASGGGTPVNHYRASLFTRSDLSVGAPASGATTDFNTWAATSGVKAVTGDFNGDGFTDIVLTGGQGWTTVPMAFLVSGLGVALPSFAVTNYSTQSGNGSSNTPIATAAATAGSQVVAGDFDGNGVWDLAITGPSSWNYVVLGMSPSVVGSGETWGGLFYVQNQLPSFALTSAKPNVYALSALHAGAFISTSAVKINAGAGASAPFSADKDFSGGATLTRSNTIDVSGVVDPAPAAVYQSQRYNNHSYVVPGFTAGSLHVVRLHFAETHWTAANKRKFNVSINGTQVLSQFDVFAAAGAANKAVIKEFLKPADAAGKLTISFVGTLDAAMVSGVEVQ